LNKRRLFTLSFFILLLALSYVSPVLADYLGPARTVTVTTTDCNVTLYSCEWVEAKGIWKYKQSDSWSCQDESKPWQKYAGSQRSCDSSNSGYEYWEKDNSESTSTITYPPATISGILQGCTLYNGWCNTNPTLGLSASEPVAGYQIANIEGTRNGVTFICPTTANCSQSLVQGNNTFSYWAHSTFGDTSVSSTLTAKVDTEAPTAGHVISGTAGTNGWYISGVTVSADGADATSGLASAQISVNGGAWQASAFLTDGTYTINSRAIDSAGNTATLFSTIHVDTTAPSLTPVIPLADGSHGWIKTGPAVVSAQGADSGSGLASAQVSVDHGAWRSNAMLTDGIHTVQFKSVDLAGNSTAATRTVKVDLTVPSVIVSTEGSAGNEAWYVSQATTIITPADSASGVDYVEYSHNGGSWQTGTSVTSIDGMNTLDVKVHDLAGNVASSSFTVKVDTIVPSVTAILPDLDGSNGWVVTGPAAVSASGSDAGSGLASAQVSGESGPWQSSLSLPDGVHPVRFKATDKAGNSSITTETIRVDTAAPLLSFTGEGTPGNSGWYVSTVTTSILSGDDTSGIASVQYNQNNTGWQDGSSFKSSDGVNTINIRVADAAGNVSADTLEVSVDTVAPSISPLIVGAPGAAGWYLSKTTTSLLSEDKTSGIDHVEYSQNGEDWQTGTSVESGDGINSISMKAYDRAGNVSAGTLEVRVDTGEPSSTFISPLNGSENNLVRGSYPISGASTDALSGVSRAELSFDGGLTWTALGLVGSKWTYDLDSTVLADGVYKAVIRTTDLAGNADTLETSPAHIRLIVNNVPPDIKLTPRWMIWQSGSLFIRSGYFPLKSGRITISDPQNRWPRVEIPFDENYPKSIQWNRRFANGILAPSGAYTVRVTACNVYNLCSNKTAVIKVPWIADMIPAPSPTPPSSADPKQPTARNVPSGLPAAQPAPMDLPRTMTTRQLNTFGRMPPAPAHAALALGILVALLWVVSAASCSDTRPLAVNAIAKTISQKQVNPTQSTKE
jgi:hypothetical protein